MVKDIIYFVIGNITSVLLTLVLFMILNLVVNLITSKKKVKIIKVHGKKLIAYLIFIIIANRIDQLIANPVLQVDGSSQFLVTIALVVREGKCMLKTIEKKLGITVPELLVGKLDYVEQGIEQKYNTKEIDNDMIRLQIRLSETINNAGKERKV